jgi:hypothetical protein
MAIQKDRHVSNLYLHWIAFIFRGATTASEPGYPVYRGFTITLRHTTLDITPLDE